MMGHPISLNFKGNEKHPTILGSFCSLTIIVLVFIQLALKSVDMVYMNDPSIQSYSRPMYPSENKE